MNALMVGRGPGKRRRFGETPTVLLTSMTDMFTLVLVFLLQFVDPSVSTDPDVSLPSAPVSDAAAEGLTLAITPNDVRVSGRPVFALAAGHVPDSVARDGKLLVPLYDALETLRPSAPDAEKTDGPLLRVECDKAVPYTVVADVLHTAGRAGFGRFQLVVLQASE